MNGECVGIRLGKKKHIVDQARHPLAFGIYGGKEVLFFFGRSFFHGGDGRKDDSQGRAKFVGCRRDELYLLLPVPLNGSEQFSGKKEGEESKQKNGRQIDQGKMNALAFDFGVQIPQGIQDKNFCILFFTDDSATQA